MKVSDVVLSSVRALRGRPRQTLLSLLGISIGVAAVLVLTGLGEGARQYLRDQFAYMGSDVLSVLPGKIETSGGVPGMGGAPNDLTLADARALRQRIPQVAQVAPVAIGTESIAHGNLTRQVVVIGSTPENAAIHRLTLQTGSFLPPGSWKRGMRVVVLGRAVAKELLGARNPLGAVVRVGGWRLRVVGVLGSQGMRFGMNMDETVFVPVATAMAMFDTHSLVRIAVQVRPNADLQRIERDCIALLADRHGEEDFTIATPDAILDSLESILDMLTLGLIGIASISLVIAGLGIMNLMLVSVSERTEEIGLSKAVGADPGQVLVLFLTEASTLSALGAALGLGVGFGLLRLAAVLYPSFPFHAPLWAAGAAASLALVVGALFGLWPAIRAVRLDPIEALTGRKP